MGEILEASLLDGPTQALARKIAAVKGKPVGDVIKHAIEQAAREAGVSPEARTEAEIAERIRRMNEIVERHSRLPVIDPRDADEIIGYDEWGLPS